MSRLEYISVKQAAQKWGISDRRVRVLCQQGKIAGARKEGRSYLIPSDALKPADGRRQRGRFVPHEFAALFARVDSLKEELDRRRHLTAGEVKRLQDEFLVEFTYSSNAIEGNTLTLRETALVLEGITINGKPLKDHLEAVGHRDAFRYVQQLVADKTPSSERVIKEIHSLVLLDKPGDKGVYRRIPVRIVGAHHEPPQPYLVPVAMERLVAEFAEDRRHPIHSAALFHMKFEGVHPFVDGNGRTGRLILNLALMRHGYPPINVKYVDRRRYYDCLYAYYRDDDEEPMVRLVAEYVEERLKQYLAALE